MQWFQCGGGSRVLLYGMFTSTWYTSVTLHIYTPGVLHILWEQGSHCISSVHNRSGPLLMDTVQEPPFWSSKSVPMGICAFQVIIDFIQPVLRNRTAWRCLINLYTCSNDSENTSHEPDASNPEWYIQTPAKKIHVTTDIVSKEHLLFKNMSASSMLP